MSFARFITKVFILAKTSLWVSARFWDSLGSFLILKSNIFRSPFLCSLNSFVWPQIIFQFPLLAASWNVSLWSSMSMLWTMLSLTWISLVRRGKRSTPSTWSCSTPANFSNVVNKSTIWTRLELKHEILKCCCEKEYLVFWMIWIWIWIWSLWINLYFGKNFGYQ